VPAAGQDILQVRIELNGQDAKVYFLTDHAQYREALDSQIENLSDRLADQGLKLTGSFVGQGGAQNSPQKQTTHNILAQRFESEAAPAKLLSIESEQRPSKSIHLGRYLDVFA
jgi:flagellar hook-length control protein FliK